MSRPGGPYTALAGADVSVSGVVPLTLHGSIVDFEWQWSDELLGPAANLPGSAIHGSDWVKESVTGSAGGTALRNPDRGAAKKSSALAAPASYVEFRAPGGGGCSVSAVDADAGRRQLVRERLAVRAVQRGD